jgi:hypothetical protein
MTSKIAWLRASYWAGAVGDFGIAVLTLVPGRMGETEYRYPMGLAAAVIFAWALLLLWADRRPLERRGVLPLTILAILGLMSAGLAAVAAGIFPLAHILPSSLLGTALIALMGFSYLNARRG